MLFNSLEFAVFLPIVFLLYWWVGAGKTTFQRTLLLLAGYVFYAWWDWRFLGLLVVLSLCNYLVGIKVDNVETNRHRKNWLLLGVFVNLGVLALFKYFHFFVDGFIDLVALTGYELPHSTTRLILPLGISFYVFLSLSYILDVYKETVRAHRNLPDVLLALSFFPIIVSGPIHRPALLLPELATKRSFDYALAVDGVKQFVWGLFVKVVIADNLAPYVDDFFKNSGQYTGSTLLLGAVFYAVQIYADFSGYSDMAIGVGKLFGFRLMRNFAYPYQARDITEFWKRWHISLTTWFRDYLFLPLSFSLSRKHDTETVLFLKKDLYIYVVVSLAVWFLTGLWHGANYTFIVWGLIHGCLLIVYRIQTKPRKKLFKKWGISNDNRVVVLAETILTASVVLVSWVFFRAETLGQAIHYLSTIVSPSLFSIPEFTGMSRGLTMVLFILGFFLLEWRARGNQYALESLGTNWKRPFRYALYYVILIAIVWFGGNGQQFIYLQF